MYFVWQLLEVYLCLLIGMGWIQARPSNPIEQMALGALNVGEQIMNTMQDGNKATKQINFDTAVMKVHSRTEMGHGNAMLPPSDDDSDESDEFRRRKKRSNHVEHLKAHRGRRSPCFKKMPTESSDDVEARKRAAAARKRAANNAVRSRIMRTTNRKQKKKKFHRERRQAGGGATAGQQAPNLGDRVKGLWLAFVDNVVDVMQQMRQQIKGAAAQATAAN